MFRVRNRFGVGEKSLSGAEARLPSYADFFKISNLADSFFSYFYLAIVQYESRGLVRFHPYGASEF